MIYAQVRAVRADQEVINFLINCGNKNLQYLLVPNRLQAALAAMDTDHDGHIDLCEWCVSESETLRCLRRGDGVLRRRRACGVAQVLSIAFCPSDPTILASGGVDKKVTLWEWRSGKQHGQPLHHSDSVRV